MTALTTSVASFEPFATRHSDDVWINVWTYDTGKQKWFQVRESWQRGAMPPQGYATHDENRSVRALISSVVPEEGYAGYADGKLEWAFGVDVEKGFWFTLQAEHMSLKLANDVKRATLTHIFDECRRRHFEGKATTTTVA